MIEVRNTLFQPLTFHLAKGPSGMQEGLHLGPRERRRIRQDQLSPEIEKAAGRGLIVLVHLPDEAPTAVPDTTVNTPEPTEAATVHHQIWRRSICRHVALTEVTYADLSFPGRLHPRDRFQFLCEADLHFGRGHGGHR